MDKGENGLGPNGIEEEGKRKKARLAYPRPILAFFYFLFIFNTFHFLLIFFKKIFNN